MQQQQQQPRRTKIYYASRTHSQLSQVVPELRRLNRRFHQLTSNSRVTTSDLAPSDLSSRKRALEETEDVEDDTVASVGRPQTRVVALGSRRQLCINDPLRAKGGNLDERCRELLSGKRCSIPFVTALCCGSPCGDGWLGPPSCSCHSSLGRMKPWVRHVRDIDAGYLQSIEKTC